MSFPETWIEVALGDVADQITKGTTPTTAGHAYQSSGIPFVKVENISNHQIDVDSVTQFISELAHEELKRSQFQVDDILFSIAGTIGKTALVTEKHIPANTNQAVAIIRGVTGFFDPEFLQLQFTHIAEKISRENSRGGAMNNVSLGDLKATIVCMPPLAEQKKIAAKLDELLAQVDTLQARLDAIPKTLKRFRQSVLAAAVSGRLTEEWRRENQLSAPALKILDNLAELITKGASPNWQGISYVEDESQTLFVTSENVGVMRALLGVKKYVEDSFNEKQKRSVLKRGDVLTNIVGASIGRATVWEADDKANINQAVCLIRLKESLCNPNYLSYFLNSPEGVSALLGNTVDVARANVSLGSIKNLEILIPSIEEQTQIVQRVEELFAFADQIEQRALAAIKNIAPLRQSILAKAFRGDLTAQWRAENPALISGENSAQALLERIRAGRKDAGDKKKNTRRSREGGNP